MNPSATDNSVQKSRPAGAPGIIAITNIGAVVSAMYRAIQAIPARTRFMKLFLCSAQERPPLSDFTPDAEPLLPEALSPSRFAASTDLAGGECEDVETHT